MPATPTICQASPGTYDYTSSLSRSRWAWEFLRRNPSFLADAARHDHSEISRREACRNITLLRPRAGQSEAERWGLAFFPDVNQDGFEADVFWNGALYPRTVSVHVSPRGQTELCDIFEQSTRLCRRIVHLTDLAGREHILLKGNGFVIQVRCEGLSLLSPEPVRMRIVIDGVSDSTAQLRTLSRALELYRGGSQPVPPEWTRSSRALCHALIALDCHLAGLSYLETARIIHGQDRASDAWNDPSDAMKSEMKRALRKGLYYCNGGYTELLGAPAQLEFAA